MLAGVLIYVLFFQDPSTEVVNERPYEEFVNETPQGDTAPNMAKQAAVPVDSLTLFITTKDTSWMKITADNVKDYEFILYPNRQKLIKAKENFKMHIGNAASVEMKLNDKPLNFNVGRRSIRNVVINAQGVTLPAGVK
ncbi:MAG TPA: RodZ domain-containing protein [Ignavibacteriales bacterium]|nr:RodZ domain-containing protein [Ignavibacteriales bacterium]